MPKKSSKKSSAKKQSVKTTAAVKKSVVIPETTVPSPKKTSARKPLSGIMKFLPWVLIVAGIIGMIASCVITVEKFDLIKNPNYQPVCDLNPIISCGSVMKSDQASAFGFMNTYIGLLGFPVVLTIGVAMLAGAQFKRWFWVGMQLGLTLGFAFAYWLLFESVYRIRALCPWCLSVDIALTTAFWYVTLYNFYTGNLKLPARFNAAGAFIKRHHVDILVFFFLVIIAEILHHFWYYFGAHL
jgi:uncharacterized membrane protein